MGVAWSPVPLHAEHGGDHVEPIVDAIERAPQVPYLHRGNRRPRSHSGAGDRKREHDAAAVKGWHRR
jgi:hypothetical protein